MSYRLGTHESCPTCEGQWEMSCRCAIGHLTCENGHGWVNCPKHGPKAAYQPPDGSHAQCSTCAKPIGEMDGPEWDKTETLQRHDLLLKAGVDPYKVRRFRDFDWHELPFQIQNSLAGKLQLAESAGLWDALTPGERRDRMQAAGYKFDKAAHWLALPWVRLPLPIKTQIQPLWEPQPLSKQPEPTWGLLAELLDW